MAQRLVVVVLVGAAELQVAAVVVAALGQAAVVALEGLVVRRLVLETAVVLVAAAEEAAAEELTTAAETPVAAELVAAHAVFVLLQTTAVSIVPHRRALQATLGLDAILGTSATNAVSASRADLMTMIKLISSAALGMAAPAIVPMVLNASIVSPATRTAFVRKTTADAWNAALVVDLVCVVNSPKSKSACHIAAVLCPGRTPVWLNVEPLFLRHVMRYVLRPTAGPTAGQSPPTATATPNAVIARSAMLLVYVCLIPIAKDTLLNMPGMHWITNSQELSLTIA